MWACKACPALADLAPDESGNGRQTAVKWRLNAVMRGHTLLIALFIYIQYGDCRGFHRFSHFRDGEPDSLRAGRDGCDLMVAQVA